ncbi:alpha-L-fucosidase [Caldanaerobius fijiensis DSM 17918]|uniref:alpha-L-fucosidase n=1 Tax=Caldanaerobius fijiensis DSM 17918 TaxID=1121256 RepID=A0A1M4VC16_9THEO|nr:alpha-L-fucosidase [Caldanaerobius fijiensis]SHE66491.1 alpha-L-fucosidase [Caldanaerobius fijiensis DSM 17918]
MENTGDRERRLKWFKEARFGMFIHWGLYSQLGRHEWVMNRERIPIEEYEKLADTWHPRPNVAREWARLAKEAGMRYMVMTTKHHEGFCLFDSKLTDYTAVKRGPGRDLVAEYVEAARAEGLRVGFYYSLMDWHHPDGARCKFNEAARRRFVDYIHGQVKELCTNYGKVDILWYDVNWPLTPEEWEAEKMNAMVRSLQPDIIINDRSGLPEDFGTPEQHITPAKEGRAWEVCMTFNDSWGYTPIDTNYKSAWTVISMLRQVAAGGGNLLLNIGPAPDGSVPEPCIRALREVGEWLRKYGASIYDASDPMEQEWMITGGFTRKGNIVYFHCNRWPGNQLAIGGLRNKVLRARFMGGDDIRFTQEKDRLVLYDLPTLPPEPLDTVIELEVEGTPRQVLGAGYKLLEEVKD